MGRNDWFPLYFDRLRQSRWWRRASDLCRARNVMLWGEAYKAVPAGSLPDNDDDLAEAAGFGFDVAGFLAAKDEIMAPWVMCSDGRWYHPTLCEVVIEAWDRVSEKRQTERIKKANQRAALHAKKAGVSSKTSPVPAETGLVPGDTANVPGDKGPNPGGHTAQERKGHERTVGSNEPVASASPEATTTTPSRKADPWDGDELFGTLWNACGSEMRRRAKSRAKVWPEWLKAKRIADPQDIVSALGIYMLMDPDVKRTGGPGLHIWLKDRGWETWGPLDMATTTIGAGWTEGQWAVMIEMWRDEGRWDAGLGPKPGEPGCRAPAHLLISATQGAAA
jgi:hypothetical protein